MKQLSSNTTLMTGPDVWIEGEALQQLSRIAALPRCAQAVGLPDIHPGPGIPIGAAFAFDGEVRPGLVGSDAGCGVRLTALPRLKMKGDQLERRIRLQLDEALLPEVDEDALIAAMWGHGPRGLRTLDGIPRALAEMAEAEPEETGWAADIDSGPQPDLKHYRARPGTVGGGNHFMEVSAVSAVPDKAAAKALGLKRGGYAVVTHSGSRGLGKALVGQWGNAALLAGQQDDYLAQLAGAVRFARANRFLLSWRMLSAVGMARLGRISGSFDVTHNTVVPMGDGRWLHRKGSAPAEQGQPTIVLGSRGAVSWVMSGQGNPTCLCSVAHGAGRRLGRSEAVGKLREKYTRASLTRTALGGRVICDDRDLLYAEHPDAYKAIEPVIAALESAGAASRVAALSPLCTVKK